MCLVVVLQILLCSLVSTCCQGLRGQIARHKANEFRSNAHVTELDSLVPRATLLVALGQHRALPFIASTQARLATSSPTSAMAKFLKSRRPLVAQRNVLLSLLLSGALIFSCGNLAFARELTADQLLAAQAWKLTDEDFFDRTFAGQDWFKLRQNMVRKRYASREQVYEEIQKMMDSLHDEYTVFLPPEKYRTMYDSLVKSQDSISLGMRLMRNDRDELEAFDVEAGSGAAQAGMRDGDIILEINGMEVRPGFVDTDVVARLQGDVVRFLSLQKGVPNPLPMVVTRQPYTTKTVTSSLEIVDGRKVGYLRIRKFAKNTPELVSKELSSLAAAGAHAFVLDLRGNPGGYANSAAPLAGEFLKKDAKIAEICMFGDSAPLTVLEDGKYVKEPVAILVNEKTASTSEIVAAALQDNKRAKLLGRDAHTFGKGAIQSLAKLKDGSAVKVTMARYLTPLGTDLDKKGIQVDIIKDCGFSPRDAVQCATDALDY